MAYELNENQKHCKGIADELENIYNGNFYRCPECGEIIKADEDNDEEIIECSCGEEIEIDDAEPFTLWDYFNGDDVYDIEYRISGNGDFRSVCLMVACGGPNIYIDTGSKRVELYWWGDEAFWSISSEVAEEINTIFEEMYACTR